MREPHTIVIARGDTIRHFTVRPWMAFLAGGLAAGLVASYVLATSYLVFRDDIIVGMSARQVRLRQSYEDRIASLRTQLDRVTSRQMRQREATDGRVSELIERQKALSERTGRLAPVFERALELGAKATGTDPANDKGLSVVNSEQPDVFYGIDPIITGPVPTRPKHAPSRQEDKPGQDKAQLLLDTVEH
ncbi:MAG: M23 family peptidase, partial [Phyllobacterium sp.]